MSADCLFLTTRRTVTATIVVAIPEVMTLTPTISPKAQLAVPGHPVMISAVRATSAMLLASIHPDDSGNKVAIAERDRDREKRLR